MTGFGRFLTALAIAVFALLSSAGDRAAYAGMEISGPAGERVPGGRIVPRGAKFTVTFSSDDLNATYHVISDAVYSGGAAYVNETIDPRSVEIDTAYYARITGNAAITRIELYLTHNAPGATGGPYPDLEIVQSENIWVLNDLARFAGALQILNEGSIHVDREIRYQVNLSDEILNFARGDQPFTPDNFWIYLARLGGTVETGIPIGESAASVARPGIGGLIRGAQELSALAPEAGLYELRLQVGDHGLIYASARFEVLPEELAREQPTWEPPVPLDLGFTREARLPNGHSYRLGEPVRIEIAWTRNAPDVPDPPDWFRVNSTVALVSPGFIAQGCVTGNLEIPYHLAPTIDLEREAPNLFATTLDTSQMPVGQYQLAVLGDNDYEESNSSDLPLEEILEFEILPPPGGGLLTYARSGDRHQGYSYEIGLTGALPASLDEVWARILRPAAQTSGGAILPERNWISQSLSDGETRIMRGGRSFIDQELQLIGRFGCGNARRDCGDVILDRVVLPAEDESVPEEVKRRLTVSPATLGVQQTWPLLTSDPVEICPRELQEPGDYQSPPFLAVEAAGFPREPVPGLPVTMAFRIENVSQLAAASVDLALTLADPRSERAPKDLEHHGNLCAPLGGGQFHCSLGDMAPGAVADLEFTAETPMTGAIIWAADLASAGDLGASVAHGGLIGARAPPRIVDAVMLNDQQRVEYETASYPYPAGANADGNDTRYLLIVGHNLPQHPRDRIGVTDTATIGYTFLAFPDTNNPHYQEWFSNGWRRFYETRDTGAARARAEEDGYDAVLVRADLLSGVMPGRHTLTITHGRRDLEASGHWALLFGELSARFEFVRLLEGGGFDVLQHAYTPERIYLAVEPNVRLPVNEIPVHLNLEDLAPGGGEIDLVARRSELGGGSIYLAGPLDLHKAGAAAVFSGGTAIASARGRDEPGLLQARIDENFVFETFRLPIDPVVASVAVGTTPGAGEHSWLWRDALNRAATCKDDVSVTDWAVLTQSQSEEIWNLIVLTTSDHFPGQSVTFGHHAATILMRDMFTGITERQLRRLEWTRNTAPAVRGLVDYMHPRAHQRGQPLLRMKVNRLDGTETEYRYAILNDTEWLAEQNGTSEAAIEAWQERATVSAIDKLIAAANETLELAREAGDCEVEDLVRMTGFNFEPVSERVKAELVTLAEAVSGSGSRSAVWVPDLSARFWIDQVAPLAEAVRRQQQISDTDTDLTLAAVTLLTLPFMLAENAAVMLVTFAIDLIDLGVSTASELSQYFASQTEVAFASGAAVTLGDARHTQALETAKGWASTSFGIGTAAFGVITGGLEVLPRIAALRRVARGRHVARTVEGAASLETLRPVDLQDFGAFAISSRMRAQEAGLETLTDIERRSLALVDEYATVNQATRLLPEPDLPAAGLVDSSAPSAPIRFDPGARDDLATARPPPGGRIETPQAGGDVPNALETRAPPNAEVHFTGANELPGSLPLGERLGGGYTSEVFAHGDDPENLAVRITYFRESSPAAALDSFGDQALRTRVRSDHVRPVRIHEAHDVPGGEFRGQIITRVSVVERMPETAQQTLARQGGQMSIAQMMAFEGAMRDINRQGLVWLDNKWDNFAFVPSPQGGGRIEVVIMDPGGIAPVRASASSSAADIARRIQLRINGDFATHNPDFAWIGNPVLRTSVRQEGIMADFGDAFDYGAMGIPGREQLIFNARSGNDFEVVVPLLDAAE